MADSAFTRIADQLTRSLLTGDFALYAGLMDLPLTTTPRGGTAYVLADIAALRRDFDLYHAAIRAQGVTDIYRAVKAVDRPDAATALVLVETHILRHAHRLTEPFASQFLLRRHGADWRISAIESSEGHINWTLGRGSLGPVPDGKEAT